MSNPIKEDLEYIQKGLFKMGRNRVAALPVHTTWEMTDEMEKRIADVIAQLNSAEK
jgi:hypothetical protein